MEISETCAEYNCAYKTANFTHFVPVRLLVRIVPSATVMVFCAICRYKLRLALGENTMKTITFVRPDV